MDITWYGLSCFRIREGGVTIVYDPYDKTLGLTLPKVRADVVTVSHDRPGHNAVERHRRIQRCFPGRASTK